MRKIDELLSFKTNLEVQHELECQILFDNRKDKIEEESLLDEYDDSIDTVSWESIEIASWNLMKTKGINWKLFSIWLESLIYIHGWDDIVFCCQALQAILTSKLDMLLDQDDRVGCIEFLDKSISRALFLQPIKDEDGLFQYLNYKKTNPQRLFDIVSSFDRATYDEFFVYHKTCVDILSSFPFLTKEVHLHFVKILDSFSKLEDILLIYSNNFIEEDVEDHKTLDVNDIPFEIDSKIKGKEDAFKLIAEALALLNESDHQNIAIPLLRKIMRWSDKNMSEILHEINDKEGAYFIISFLMD